MQTVINLITSGDISGAESWFQGLSAAEVAKCSAAAVRAACSRWGIDPTRFGARPVAPCPPALWFVRAGFTLPAVPVLATSNDFQAAMMEASGHPEEGAYLWRAEAVRFRLENPVAPLDVEAITVRAVSLRDLFRRRRGA